MTGECGFCKVTLAMLLTWDRAKRLDPVSIQSARGEDLLSDTAHQDRLRFVASHRRCRRSSLRWCSDTYNLPCPALWSAGRPRRVAVSTDDVASLRVGSRPPPSPRPVAASATACLGCSSHCRARALGSGEHLTSERDRTFGAQAQAARLDPLRHYRSWTRAGVSVAGRSRLRSAVNSAGAVNVTA